jgi:flagella basal body P-ring formation protein FlgA
MIRLMLIFASVFMTMNAPHAEPQWQTHESIYEAVKSYVAQNINTTAEYEINVVQLMDRLNLPLCSQPIQAFTPNPLKVGRASINVRCNVGKKWAIFVPAMITPFEHIVISTQPLQRGEMVTEQLVTLARKDVSQLHGNYLTQLEQVLNKQAVRTLPVGTIMMLKDFVEPNVVKRGDRVMITSSRSGVAIKMNGIVESDGRRGQVIRVKNQNSGRVINAIVIDSGQVSVSQ